MVYSAVVAGGMNVLLADSRTDSRTAGLMVYGTVVAGGTNAFLADSRTDCRTAKIAEQMVYDKLVAGGMNVLLADSRTDSRTAGQMVYGGVVAGVRLPCLQTAGHTQEAHSLLS